MRAMQRAPQSFGKCGKLRAVEISCRAKPGEVAAERIARRRRKAAKWINSAIANGLRDCSFACRTRRQAQRVQRRLGTDELVSKRDLRELLVERRIEYRREYRDDLGHKHLQIDYGDTRADVERRIGASARAEHVEHANVCAGERPQRDAPMLTLLEVKARAFLSRDRHDFCPLKRLIGPEGLACRAKSHDADEGRTFEPICCAPVWANVGRPA